jgi:hypothetical protein
VSDQQGSQLPTFQRTPRDLAFALFLESAFRAQAPHQCVGRKAFTQAIAGHAPGKSPIQERYLGRPLPNVSIKLTGTESNRSHIDSLPKPARFYVLQKVLSLAAVFCRLPILQSNVGETIALPANKIVGHDTSQNFRLEPPYV